MNLVKCFVSKVWKAAMHTFAHFLDKTLHPIQPILFLLAIGAWIFAVIGQFQFYRSRKPDAPRKVSPKFLVGLLTFAVIIGGQFAIAGIIKSAALEEN